MTTGPESSGGPKEPWRPFGHPLHPAMTHFPMALLGSTVAWDAVAALTGDPFWSRMALWSLVAGLIAAVPTLITGLIEYAALGLEHPAMSRANLHMMLMLVAVTLFGVSALFRGAEVVGETVDPVVALVASAVAVGVLGVGGWAGADLVYRHGVGVHGTGPSPDAES